MKILVVCWLMIGSVLCSAQRAKEPDLNELKKLNQDSGFWPKNDHTTLTLMDYKVTTPQKEWKKRLPEHVRDSAASSGLPKWVMVKEVKVDLLENAKMQGAFDKHLISGKVQKAPFARRAQRVFLFMGGETLVHGQKVLPIAMPDVDGNFSFYPEWVMSVVRGEINREGNLLIPSDDLEMEPRYPDYLYVATAGSRIYRVKLDKPKRDKEE